MSFVDSHARTKERNRSNLFCGMVLFCAVTVVSAQPVVQAQPPDTLAPRVTAPIAKSSAPTAIANQTGPQWNDLNGTQKQILRPLAGTWNSMGVAHKNKWIALAVNYPSKAPAEQEKMQSRMVEWAALSPSDRALARLNFAETKKIAPSDRAAEWEAYQSLSAQEKQRLAAKGNGKPTGAAIAVTPIPASKLASVPITRRTAQQGDSTVAGKPRIDPNTLLPKPPLPAPSTPAPAIDPVAPAASEATAPASEPLSPASAPN
jgi:hypothetical protein